MEENSKYMESLSAKINALKAQLEQLILGDGGLNSFLKNLVDLGTIIVKFLNNTGALEAGFVVLAGILSSKIIPLFASFEVNLQLAISRMLFAISTTSTLTLAMGGLTAILALGVVAWNLYKTAQEKAIQKTLDSIEAYNDYKKTLQQNLSTINDESTSKAQLIEMNKQLDDSYASESANLKNINELRQEAIDKLYQEAQAKAQSTVRETGSEYESSKDFLESGYSVNTALDPVMYETPTKALEVLNETIDEYNKKIENGTGLTDAENRALKNLEKQHSKLQSKIDESTKITEGYEEAQETLSQSKNDWVNAMEKESNQADSTSNAIDGLTDSEDENSDATDTVKTKAEELAGAWSDAQDGISDISSAYDTLSDAVKDYNKNGYMSVENTQKLLALDPEYLAMLQNENGQLSINSTALKNKMQAQIDSAKAVVYETATQKLLALANASSAESTDTLASSKLNAIGSIDSNTNSVLKNTKALYLNAGASALKSKNKFDAKEIIKETKAQIDALDGVVSQLGKNITATNNYTGATNKSTTATNKSTTATKSQTTAEDKLIAKLKKKKEALEDLQDNYETVFDYMKDVVEEEIDKLNDKRDKEIAKIDKKRKKLEETYTKEKNSINTQITMLEWEEEARLKAYDETINSLNSQKDVVEDYYDTEIEKLQNVNDEISDQIKLQEYQEALARAKASKKMVLGESGFEYRVDEESVASTTQDLQQYQSEKARQDAIDALQNQKDIQVKALEAQIAYQEQMKAETQEYYDTEIEKLNTQLDALENMYDAFNTAYDKQEEKINNKYDALIKKKNNYLDKLDKAEKKYERLQAKQLAKVLYGKNFENQTNAQRLANLQSFVTAYNATLSQLGNVSTSLTNAQNKTSSTTTSKKATGDASIDSDGAYIVGDSPNTELVIGSKLNGVPMNLSKGTGVVNAKSTKTLAGLFNSLNGLSSNTPNNSTSNVSQDIIIENVNLDNVTDGQSFINEIKEFRNNMIQKSYSF